MTEQRHPSPSAGDSSLPAASLRTIVVVEDQPDILDILRRYLRIFFSDSTHELLICKSGKQARELMATRQIHVLITDYNMPEMNGLQLARELKAVSPAAFIILITAYATPDLMDQAGKAGVDAYLAKPFTLDTLETVLRSLPA
jgi:two-component system chemotaxis response regulator CheY